MSKAKDTINSILSLIDDAMSTFEENKTLMAERDKEVTDLYHEIELTKFNAYGGYRLAKELHTVLQERRQYKNENRTLDILVDFLLKNPQFKNGLIQCSQRIKQSESNIENLKFTPRVRTDLNIAN